MSGRGKMKIARSRVVRVVGDGALAGAIADGRFIPVLIIDTAGRPDIREVIRQHEHLNPGNARHQWVTSRDDKDTVMLLLTFDRPSDVDVVLSFSIEHQGILVDSMIRSGVVYLQSGSEGDRLSSTLDEPKVLVELLDSGFSSQWESLFEKQMTRVMAAQMRVSRRKARSTATRLIAETRELTALRLRS